MGVTRTAIPRVCLCPEINARSTMQHPAQGRAAGFRGDGSRFGAAETARKRRNSLLLLLQSIMRAAPVHHASTCAATSSAC